MPVLDAHTHLFPPEIIEKRERIASDDRAFGIIYSDRKARMADGQQLSGYLEKEGIDVVVACGFPFRDPGLVRLTNDYVLEIARGDRRIVPFAIVDPAYETASIREAERCLERGARGIGEIAYYGGGFGESERRALNTLATWMEQAGMVLMLHVNEQVGHAYPGKTAVDFGEIIRFLEDHPSLKIILAHMGGGICFYEFMPEIRKSCSLVYYDLAAVPFLYSEAIYRFAAQFLWHKVLFGSDYPLLPYSRYKSALEKLDGEARERILYSNGKELLGL
jgi:predicted TIM-barrel fold metal-dependent hydrolase